MTNILIDYNDNIQVKLTYATDHFSIYVFIGDEYHIYSTLNQNILIDIDRHSANYPRYGQDILQFLNNNLQNGVVSYVGKDKIMES